MGGEITIKGSAEELAWAKNTNDVIDYLKNTDFENFTLKLIIPSRVNKPQKANDNVRKISGTNITSV